MNALINRLISEAVAPVEKMSARLFKKAVLFFVTMSALFVSSVFVTIAFFFFIQKLAGPAIAALSAGGLYLGAALICIAVALRESSPHGAMAAAESGRRTETKSIPPQPNFEFASNIDEAIVPVLAVLRDAGFERESAALAAGAEIAKQLRPFSLTALAIVAGIIIGRMLKQRNITPG